MAGFIRIGVFVIAWFSIVFLPKDVFKKYFPVANLACSFILIQSLISVPFKLWTVKGGMKEKIFNDLSFILGPFFLGTIWIFHFTFGKFGLYFLVNVVINYLFAYPMCYLFKKLNVFKLVNFKPIHVFVLYVFYSVVIYGYHLYLYKPKETEPPQQFDGLSDIHP